MTQLGLDEFLKACEIPSAQLNYTGSDTGTSDVGRPRFWCRGSLRAPRWP